MEPAAAYRALYQQLKQVAGLAAWPAELQRRIEDYFANPPHGDYRRWDKALQQLPKTRPKAALDQAAPSLGSPAPDLEAAAEVLQEFHPWRKGPLHLAGVNIDTEWRSDMKWRRLADHVDLSGHHVLDIGCGNGYFGWRMLGVGADWVLGIDPTLVFVLQWLACHRFSGALPNYVAPLRLEDLPRELTGFDSVFSMGVLYHRRNPFDHLRRLKTLIRAGGQVVLETLVVDDDQFFVLVPAERYARMRNVWFIPSLATLGSWIEQSGFDNSLLLDVSETSLGEQRSTGWMKFESLAQALDPNNNRRTIEGYPRPVRAMFLLEKKAQD